MEYEERMSGIEHQALSKIHRVFDKAAINDNSRYSKGNMEKYKQFAAVLVVKDSIQHFLNVFDLILKWKSFPEKLSQFLTFQVFQLIKFIHSKGIKNCFRCRDVFMDTRTADIRIYNYGDKYFVKESRVPATSDFV